MKTFLLLSLLLFIGVGISIIPFLLVHFISYEPDVHWNENAIKLDCIVIEYFVDSYRCSGQTHNSRRNHPCYDGYVRLNYTVNDNSYINHIRIYKRSSSQKDLNKQYPIGEATDCYINEDNPNDVRLKLIDTKKAFIVNIVVLVLCLILIFAFEIPLYILILNRTFKKSLCFNCP